MIVAWTCLAVSLDSSAYSGGIYDIMQDFDVERELALLGISVFVLGFAFVRFSPTK